VGITGPRAATSPWGIYYRAVQNYGDSNQDKITKYAGHKEHTVGAID